MNEVWIPERISEMCLIFSLFWIICNGFLKAEIKIPHWGWGTIRQPPFFARDLAQTLQANLREWEESPWRGLGAIFGGWAKSCLFSSLWISLNQPLNFFHPSLESTVSTAQHTRSLGLLCRYVWNWRRPFRPPYVENQNCRTALGREESFSSPTYFHAEQAPSESSPLIFSTPSFTPTQGQAVTCLIGDFHFARPALSCFSFGICSPQSASLWSATSRTPSLRGGSRSPWLPRSGWAHSSHSGARHKEAHYDSTPKPHLSTLPSSSMKLIKLDLYLRDSCVCPSIGLGQDTRKSQQELPYKTPSFILLVKSGKCNNSSRTITQALWGRPSFSTNTDSGRRCIWVFKF